MLIIGINVCFLSRCNGLFEYIISYIDIYFAVLNLHTTHLQLHMFFSKYFVLIPLFIHVPLHICKFINAEGKGAPRHPFSFLSLVPSLTLFPPSLEFCHCGDFIPCLPPPL